MWPDVKPILEFLKESRSLALAIFLAGVACLLAPLISFKSGDISLPSDGNIYLRSVVMLIGVILVLPSAWSLLFSMSGSGTQSPTQVDVREQAASNENITDLPPVNSPRLGTLPQALSENDKIAFCVQYPEWKIVKIEDAKEPGKSRCALYRVYEFPTFDLAWKFMNEVVNRGIKHKRHHPKWLNTYNRVEVWLTTFNLDYKPSVRDKNLAVIFEEVWREFQSKYFKEVP